MRAVIDSLDLYSRKIPPHQGADFPAIVPRERSEGVMERGLTSEESSVRGTLVMGLTAEDVATLDAFEGDVCIRSFHHKDRVPLIVISGRSNTSACRCACVL